MIDDELKYHVIRLYKALGYPTSPDKILVLNSPQEFLTKNITNTVWLAPTFSDSMKIRVLPIPSANRKAIMIPPFYMTRISSIIIQESSWYPIPNMSYIVKYQVPELASRKDKIILHSHNYFTESFGFAWFYKTMAVFMRHPKYNLEESTRILHHTTKPVVKYPDGWSLYFLNDVLMPDQVFARPPDQLNISHLMMKYPNSAVRKEIAKLVGPARIIEAFNAKVLDRWLDYTLYTMHITGMRTIIRCLRMVNPSTGEEHWEYVHPDCVTIQGALNWRLGGLRWNPTQLT